MRVGDFCVYCRSSTKKNWKLCQWSNPSNCLSSLLSRSTNTNRKAIDNRYARKKPSEWTDHCKILCNSREPTVHVNLLTNNKSSKAPFVLAFEFFFHMKVWLWGNITPHPLCGEPLLREYGVIYLHYFCDVKYHLHSCW